MFVIERNNIAIQKSFGGLEAGPTVEPAFSLRERTFLDKYMFLSTGSNNFLTSFLCITDAGYVG